MDDCWDDYADGWDSNPAVITYADNAYLALKQIVNPAGYRILDFGCGTGLLTERMVTTARSVVSLDPSPKMISVLKHKHLGNVSTIAAELDQHLINENTLLTPTFDLVVASSALAFVPDYPKTLTLLKQLLNKGGWLVQWDWLKKDPDDSYGFTERQITTALTEIGFTDCSTSVPFSMHSDNSEMGVVMGVARNI